MPEIAPLNAFVNRTKISLFGCFLGSVLGVHCMSKSARIGGIVLIAIAIKQLF